MAVVQTKERPVGDSVAGSVASGHWRRFGLALAVLTLAWILPLRDLFQVGMKVELFSHVLLVPVVCAYLIWVDRTRLPATGRPWLALGIPTAVLSILVVLAARSAWAASVVGLPLTLDITGFVLAVVAAMSWVMGSAVTKNCLPALAFLVFFIPLPEIAVAAIETFLQDASASTVEVFFGMTGVPNVREGRLFRLPGLTIEVARECSGIRSTYVLVMVSVIAAQLFLRAWWRRCWIIAVTVPLGILRNAFRIWLLSVLTIHVDRGIINSALHHRGGPLFFAVALIPAFLLLWWLVRSERKSGATEAIREGRK